MGKKWSTYPSFAPRAVCEEMPFPVETSFVARSNALSFALREGAGGYDTGKLGRPNAWASENIHPNFSY